MVTPGRSYTAGTGYRYGFNGKENDTEVKGTANQQDYGMRIYDPRVGRFLSVDPLTKSYPMLTPYQFASNSPIVSIDLDGEESILWYLAEAAENKIFGTTHLQNIRSGYQQRLQKVVLETATGWKNMADGTWDRLSKPGVDNPLIFPMYGCTDCPQTSVKRQLKEKVKEVKTQIKGTVYAIGKDYSEIAEGVVNGNDKQIGAALFESSMLFIPGDEIRYTRYSSTVKDLVKKTIIEKGGREIISITKSASRVDALKVAKDILGDLGKDAIGLPGKSTSGFPNADKVIVGVQSKDGMRGWRVDFDDKKGAHINWFNNATGEKGAIPFDGTKAQVDYLKQQLSGTYNNPASIK